MNHIDQAEKLLLMASKDMKAMDLMITPESIDDEILAFMPSSEQMWLDEAERRLNDHRAGKVQGIPGNEVFKRAIAEL